MARSERRVIEGTGYLKFVKSKGHLYIYLHGRLQGEKVKKHLFKFGRSECALENLYCMREANRLPNELAKMGFTFDDLDQWILTIETRVTPTGKKINILE